MSTSVLQVIVICLVCYYFKIKVLQCFFETYFTNSMIYQFYA